MMDSAAIRGAGLWSFGITARGSQHVGTGSKCVVNASAVAIAAGVDVVIAGAATAIVVVAIVGAAKS